jgi:hypothetical protein
MLYRLSDHDGVLQSVFEYRFEQDSGFVTRIDFVLGDLTAIFVANGDYDTLEVHLDEYVADADCKKIEVSKSSRWSDFLGKGFFWMWELTNSQGYVDGVRIEFGSIEASKTIELVVYASALKVFEVLEK